MIGLNTTHKATTRTMTATMPPMINATPGLRRLNQGTLISECWGIREAGDPGQRVNQALMNSRKFSVWFSPYMATMRV